MEGSGGKTERGKEGATACVFKKRRGVRTSWSNSSNRVEAAAAATAAAAAFVAHFVCGRRWKI